MATKTFVINFFFKKTFDFISQKKNLIGKKYQKFVMVQS